MDCFSFLQLFSISMKDSSKQADLFNYTHAYLDVTLISLSNLEATLPSVWYIAAQNGEELWLKTSENTSDCVVCITL